MLKNFRYTVLGAQTTFFQIISKLFYCYTKDFYVIIDLLIALPLFRRFEISLLVVFTFDLIFIRFHPDLNMHFLIALLGM